MTARRVYAWGAAIALGGTLLGVTAALWIGRPDTLGRSLLIGATACLASGALVLRWGLDVYGPRGALAAAALSAFTPPVLAAVAAPSLQAPAGATVLAGTFAQLLAAYALTRCLLDPTLQWVLVAGLAIVATPIGAFLHGDGSVVLAAMGGFSVLLVAWRTRTADRCESRARVARASAVSVALAWLLAATVTLMVTALSHLPSFEDYCRTRGGPATQHVARQAPAYIAVAAAAETSADQPRPPASRATGLPLAALLIAVARPWRRARRYSDGAWLLALLCIGAPLWLAWGAPGGVFMTPFAALLAGAAWDASRPLWMRRAATAVVVAQLAVALMGWPHWPGGVRPDAWLPMSEVDLPRREEGR